MDTTQQNALFEMERALIGALINLSGNGLDAQQAAFRALKPYTFADVYNPTNQSIFSSVASMVAEGTICTPELLFKRLVDRGALDDIGGLGVIIGICKDALSFSSIDSVKGLAKTLAEESRRRNAFELETIIRQGEADNRPLDDVLTDAQALIDSLKGQGKASKLKLSAWRDISKPKPINWLIAGVLEANNLACLYGASGCGKSFIAVDLSLCIASGIQWHGHSTKQGSVVYFAGEGREGLRRRVAAWVQNTPECAVSVADHFLLADRACLLPDDATEVIDSLRQVANPRLLVLDTLNRTMLGDENATRDMTAYVQACDKIKTTYPELTILIIHHTGHGSQDRARGSVVLKSSLEVEIKATKTDTGFITLESTKAKDAEPFQSMGFQLESIELEGWHQNDGTPVQSAWLKPCDLLERENQSTRYNKVSGKNQQAAITILRALSKHSHNNLEAAGYDTHQSTVLFDDWQSECLKQSLAQKPSHFRQRIFLPIQEAGIATLKVPYVYLNE